MSQNTEEVNKQIQNIYLTFYFILHILTLLHLDGIWRQIAPSTLEILVYCFAMTAD